MKAKTKLTALLLAAAALGAARAETPVPTPSVAPAPDERLIIISANDSLKFSVTKIVASPGERLHVQLRNQGTLPKATMGHNWILLDELSEATPYAVAAMSDRADGYQPKALKDHVLASIPLLGPGEVGDVVFTCPAKPGRYPFICSCSGHAMAGMHGELVVQ